MPVSRSVSLPALSGAGAKMHLKSRCLVTIVKTGSEGIICEFTGVCSGVTGIGDGSTHGSIRIGGKGGQTFFSGSHGTTCTEGRRHACALSQAG